jgi:hypothetical protein
MQRPKNPGASKLQRLAAVRCSDLVRRRLSHDFSNHLNRPRLTIRLTSTIVQRMPPATTAPPTNGVLLDGMPTERVTVAAKTPNAAPHPSKISTNLPTRSFVIVSSRNIYTPNAPAHRRRANDVRLSTEARSRRSVQPVCSPMSS